MFPFSNQIAANLADLIDYAYTLSEGAVPGKNPPPLPLNPPAGYTIVALAQATDDFLGYKSLQYYGIVATSTTEVVIAIRGTGDKVEWLIDFEFKLTPFQQGLGRVEDGFYSIFQSMQFVDCQGNPFQLAPYLTGVLAQNPGMPVIVAGHSLGGALVSMLAVQLSQASGLKNALQVLTLASPAPGDDAFAAYYNGNVPATQRIWNPWDLVPHAPPACLGFSQVAGAGQKLSPNWDQKLHYDFLSADCNHSLVTYQWLLDASGHGLNSSCEWFEASAATPGTARATRLASAVKRGQQAEAGAKS